MITSAKFIISATNFSQSPHFALSEVAFLGRSNVGKSSLINALTHQKHLAKSSATPGKTRLINFFEVSFKLNLKEQNLSILADKNASQNLRENSGVNLNSNANACKNLNSQNDENQNLNAKQNAKFQAQNSNANLNSNENSSQNAEFQSENSKENLNSHKNSSANLNFKENLNSSTNSSQSDKFTLIFVDLPGFGYAKVSHAQRAEWDKNLDEFLKKRQAIRLFVHLRDARHENLALDESINEYLQSLKSPSQSILQVFTKADKLNQSQKARLNKTYPNALLVSSAKNTGLAQLENALLSHTLGRANA